jgi:hypothetical protein
MAPHLAPVLCWYQHFLGCAASLSVKTGQAHSGGKRTRLADRAAIEKRKPVPDHRDGHPAGSLVNRVHDPLVTDPRLEPRPVPLEQLHVRRPSAAGPRCFRRPSPRQPVQAGGAAFAGKERMTYGGVPVGGRTPG